MSITGSEPSGFPAFERRRQHEGHGRSGSQLRCSDSERAEVAALLSQHFSDGRLDAAELDDRLSRTWSARTRADLGVLLEDLPALAAAPGSAPEAGVPAPSPRYRHSRHRLVRLVTLMFALPILVPVVAAVTFHLPALVLLTLGALVLARHRGRRSWPCGSRHSSSAMR